MRRDELKNAFGEPLIEFDASLNRALANIPDERHAHRRYKIAPLIAAIVCALALGGAALAVANNWDIFDMMGRSRSASDDSDTLRALSQSPDMVVEGKWVTYTLSEAVFDGRSLNVTINARPHDPAKVLLMSDYCTDVDDLAPEYGGDNEPSGETFAQKAAREGSTLVMTGMSISGAGASDQGGSEYYNADGSLTLYAHCLLDGDASGQQRFTCHIREREVNGDDIERFEGAFEIAPNTPLAYAEAHGEYLTELARITDVRVSKSALATYVSASGRLYANLSDEQLEQWKNSTVDFSTSESYSTIIEGNMRMLDENGEDPGSIDGERCFRMEFVMEASEAMPKQLYVKLYNLDTNEYGKTVVIPLTPIESEEQ